MSTDHQHHDHQHGPDCGHDHDAAPAESKAIDPVCGMTVDPATAKNSADHQGQTYYFCCAGCKTKFTADPQKYLDAQAAKQKQETAGVLDPVCGMTVDPATAKHKSEHAGHPYFFCSAGCKTKFEANPAKYLGPREPEPVIEGAIYTCPMDPEIRQIGPGTCPICGMALEPELVTADTGPNPELIDMTRRFWIGLALAIPVMAVEMGGHFMPADKWLTQATANYIQFAFATPVVLWVGWPFFERGYKSLVTRNLNMFTLIAMGTGVAYVYSVIATFAPGIFPAGVSRSRRQRRGLFRSRQHDHRAGGDRPGAGTTRARSDLRRDQGAAEPRAQDRAPRQGRRQRRGSRARCDPRRRFFACTSRRQGAGRRHRTRRSFDAR